MVADTLTSRLPDAPSRDRLLVREVDGEMLILDTVADRIHRLNPTASVIWRLADHGAARSDIENELMSQFDADLETIRRDVDEALNVFHSLHLVRR